MTIVEASGMEIPVVARRWSPRVSSMAVLRGLDVSIGALMLMLFLPLIAVVALSLRVQDGGPVLFRQTRVGRDGEPFRCLKFRSMAVDAEDRLLRLLQENDEARLEGLRDRKLRHDPRVTPLGRLLRLTSIDELPQLLNVLRGDMSLIGPRPIVAEEVALYGRRFRHYAAIRPGLTGLWQVMGRNGVAYRRRVAMDVWLSRNLSVKTYLFLLARTVIAVLKRDGAC